MVETRAIATKPIVLVVDDDPDVVKLLSIQLEHAGYEVLTAYDGTQGLRRAQQERPDLVVLDVMMPGQSGYEVCQQLRLVNEDVPILLLTARSDSVDTIAGLNSGANVFLSKPYDSDILLAHVRMLLQRRPKGPLTVLGTGTNVQIDRLHHEVTVRGKRVELTPHEYRLLLVLAERPGEVLSHEYLFTQVWGPYDTGAHEKLKVFVWLLRQKIEENPKAPRLLQTVWGVGYKLVVSADQPVAQHA